MRIVSNSNGVNFNSATLKKTSSFLTVSNSNGVNFNDGIRDGINQFVKFQTPTE